MAKKTPRGVPTYKCTDCGLEIIYPLHGKIDRKVRCFGCDADYRDRLRQQGQQVDEF